MIPQPIRSAGRILAFAQTLRGGGVERALLRMARGWIDAGRHVTLVVGEASGAIAHELPAGVELRELGDARYAALLVRLPGIVRETAPDIVFCPGNHYTAIAWALRIGLGGNCPPIVGKVSNALVRHDMAPLAAWGYRRWLRHHRRFLDAVVAMTPAMAGEAAAALGMGANAIRVIPNPPAIAVPGATPLSLPDRRFILGVGRLAPQKRWDRLIDALPRLRDRDVMLLVLGEGAERPALEARIARAALTARVRLPGHAPDPLVAIARAAVVALTSDYEGVPGVLREAIALGTPVVATDSSVAIRELIDSPATGTIVPRDDPAALVAALDHWLASDRERPAPRPDAGPDPIAAYLDLFDTLVQRNP